MLYSCDDTKKSAQDSLCFCCMHKPKTGLYDVTQIMQCTRKRITCALSWQNGQYSKTCVKRPPTKRQKISFQDQLSLNAGQKYCKMLQGEHSAILLTFIKLPFVIKVFVLYVFEWYGAQWLSGRVLDSRPRGCGFEPHRRHCVVVLEQDTFILA